MASGQISGRAVYAIPSGTLEYVEVGTPQGTRRYVPSATGQLVLEKRPAAGARNTASDAAAGNAVFDEFLAEFKDVKNNVSAPKQAGARQLRTWLGGAAGLVARRLVVGLLVAALSLAAASAVDPGVRAVLRKLLAKIPLPQNATSRMYASAGAAIVKAGGWVSTQAVAFWTTFAATFSPDTVNDIIARLSAVYTGATAGATAKVSSAKRVYTEARAQNAARRASAKASNGRKN